MNAAPHSPAGLPAPSTPRWQPLRLGLVELYHYDYEVFPFRDGRLLLRGNNGTGKSKVLSLALPFLFDARLASSRIEPDGDRNKRMDWNLLMGRHAQRTGYTWLEFGRLDADTSEPRFVTLGCGLRAIAGRPRVDAWFFTTRQRVGDGLELVSPDRVVVTRERLAEAIGANGQVHATAQAYRRSVDEQLFGLGAAGYDALVDTLILLRQPQLSKRPDEAVLSQVLTGALPPFPEPVLDDVAEAFGQLEGYRDEVAAVEKLGVAIGGFTRSYARYCAVRSRREARRLRQAQTEFDAASRALAALRGAHDEAERAVAGAQARQSACEIALERSRAALATLNEDPINRDARRLHDLERLADDRRADHQQATARLETAAGRAIAERGESEARDARAERAAERERQAAVEASAAATAAGVASEQFRAQDVADLARRRRDQIAAVRERIASLEQAGAATRRARDGVEVRREALGDAEAREGRAERALDCAAAALRDGWSACLSLLAALSVPEPEAVLASLDAWTETLHDRNPATSALQAAHARATHVLAADRTALSQQRQALEEEDALLATEQADLCAGVDREPPAPATRGDGVRTNRAGAPLWKLVDFRDTLPAEARAGLEAALEGSGLLDAWLTPAGDLLDPDTLDAWLTARDPQPASLRDWLVPDPLAPVGAEVVDAVLASIAVDTRDVPGAECWVSPSGRFRTGARTGAWRKDVAEHVGFPARSAAREKRLGEIARRRADLARDREAAERTGTRLEAHGRQLDAELADAPADDALRDAHAEFSAAGQAARDAAERLAAAEQLAAAAVARERELREVLEADAGDLRLPPDRAGLERVERAVADYERLAERYRHAVEDAGTARAEQARQRDRLETAVRERDVASEEVGERLRLAEAAAAGRDAMREAVGATVAEHEARVRETERAITSERRALEVAREASSVARERRGHAGARVEDAVGARDTCDAARRAEVGQLRRFAATGLLAIAAPAVETPPLDDDWAVDPALQVARRAEQALAKVPAGDSDWDRVQRGVTQEFTDLNHALSVQGYRAQAEQTDFGLVVGIVYHGREVRPDTLSRQLDAELAERRQILTEREREVLENHLEAEVAVNLQRLMQHARDRVDAINAELDRRPTATGMRFRLHWRARAGGDAPPAFARAREVLVNRSADAWSPADRELVGAFLHERIAQQAALDDGASLRAQLERALDYRHWHEFQVARLQDGAWRSLAGPASSGERALGLTVPLFAAASSHYASAGRGDAPRLVLLDEAFAGIDDEARAQCMALIRAFDLDLVMTSEREWGCYAELPGISICHLLRRDGIDAVHVSRWTWDGRSRVPAAEPVRPFEVPAEMPVI